LAIGSAIRSYKDLEVWLKAMSLAESCYRARELETHLNLAGRIGLLRSDALSDLLDECESISKMLRSLIRSLETRT